MSDRSEVKPKDLVFTIPNVLSFLRLAGVPVFVWLIVGPHADFIALVFLVASAVSDWADGMLARKLGQVSRIGQLLDPLADRLYIIAILIAFVVRDIVPLWFVIALVSRDVLLLFVLLLLRRYGYESLQVNFIGKTATLCLLAAFPTLLLAKVQLPGWFSVNLANVLQPLGWAFAWWGLALYWLAGFLYLWQTVRLLRDMTQTEVLRGPSR